jgi:hypothetical protein
MARKTVDLDEDFRSMNVSVVDLRCENLDHDHTGDKTSSEFSYKNSEELLQQLEEGLASGELTYADVENVLNDMRSYSPVKRAWGFFGRKK